VREIGSRVVTGANYRSRFENVDYIGFDLQLDPNVDVVGDGHKLSDFFEEESFDLIFLRLYLSAYTYHGLLLKKFKKY